METSKSKKNCHVLNETGMYPNHIWYTPVLNITLNKIADRWIHCLHGDGSLNEIFGDYI